MRLDALRVTTLVALVMVHQPPEAQAWARRSNVHDQAQRRRASNELGKRYESVSDIGERCPSLCNETESTGWDSVRFLDDFNLCQDPILFKFINHADSGSKSPRQEVQACTVSHNENHGIYLDTSGDTRHSPNVQGQVAQLALSHQPSWTALTANKVNSSIATIGHLSQSIPEGHIGQGDATMNFAYFNGTVAGLHSGSVFHKRTIASVSSILLKSLKDQCSAGTTVAQICDNSGISSEVFGIVLDSAGNFTYIRDAAVSWSHGKCFELQGHAVMHIQTNTKVWRGRQNLYTQLELRNLNRRGDCRTITVASGDSCDTLAARCGIPGDEFLSYNKNADLCSALVPDQLVCCSEGPLPGDSSDEANDNEKKKDDDDAKPDEGGDAVPVEKPKDACNMHQVIEGDTCFQLAQKYRVTVDVIESLNKERAEGWTGCLTLTIGTDICVGEKKPATSEALAGKKVGEKKQGEDNSGEKGDHDKSSPQPSTADDVPATVPSGGYNPKNDENVNDEGDSPKPSTTEYVPATVPSGGYNPRKDEKAPKQCAFFNPPDWDLTRKMCEEPCKDVSIKAADEKEVSNYGCVGDFPLGKPIPYENKEGYEYALGVCVCNSELVNIFFQFFVDAMAAIAQVSTIASSRDIIFRS